MTSHDHEVPLDHMIFVGKILLLTIVTDILALVHDPLSFITELIVGLSFQCSAVVMVW